MFGKFVVFGFQLFNFPKATERDPNEHPATGVLINKVVILHERIASKLLINFVKNFSNDLVIKVSGNSRDSRHFCARKDRNAWRLHRLRTTAENKKRENGEDFNLHPPYPRGSHLTPHSPPGRPCLLQSSGEPSYFLQRGGRRKVRGMALQRGRRRRGQTVGNIIAARAERNYRFALGVPSFFPILASLFSRSPPHPSSFVTPLPPPGPPTPRPSGYPSRRAPA